MEKATQMLESIIKEYFQNNGVNYEAHINNKAFFIVNSEAKKIFIKRNSTISHPNILETNIIKKSNRKESRITNSKNNRNIKEDIRKKSWETVNCDAENNNLNNNEEFNDSYSIQKNRHKTNYNTDLNDDSHFIINLLLEFNDSKYNEANSIDNNINKNSNYKTKRASQEDTNNTYLNNNDYNSNGFSYINPEFKFDSKKFISFITNKIVHLYIKHLHFKKQIEEFEIYKKLNNIETALTKLVNKVNFNSENYYYDEMNKDSLLKIRVKELEKIEVKSKKINYKSSSNTNNKILYNSINDSNAISSNEIKLVMKYSTQELMEKRVSNFNEAYNNKELDKSDNNYNNTLMTQNCMTQYTTLNSPKKIKEAKEVFSSKVVTILKENEVQLLSPLYNNYNGDTTIIYYKENKETKLSSKGIIDDVKSQKNSIEMKNDYMYSKTNAVKNNDNNTKEKSFSVMTDSNFKNQSSINNINININSSRYNIKKTNDDEISKQSITHFLSNLEKSNTNKINNKSNVNNKISVDVSDSIYNNINNIYKNNETCFDMFFEDIYYHPIFTNLNINNKLNQSISKILTSRSLEEQTLTHNRKTANNENMLFSNPSDTTGISLSDFKLELQKNGEAVLESEPIQLNELFLQHFDFLLEEDSNYLISDLEFKLKSDITGSKYYKDPVLCRCEFIFELKDNVKCSILAKLNKIFSANIIQHDYYYSTLTKLLNCLLQDIKIDVFSLLENELDDSKSKKNMCSDCVIF